MSKFRRFTPPRVFKTVLSKLSQQKTYTSDIRELQIGNEIRDLVELLDPKPVITYTDAELTLVTSSDVDNRTLLVKINTNDPASATHELGHYVDYIQNPRLSDNYEFQWIVSEYIKEIYKEEPDWGNYNYYIQKEEIFARLFQQWYQDIDSRLDVTRTGPDYPHYSNGDKVAERLYKTMPEVKDYFLTHCADIYNHIHARIEEEYSDTQNHKLD